MTLDAQKAFSGTVAPEGADVLDEAKLTAWMEANVEGFEGPLTQHKFAGGQSNPTYKISAPSGNYVLRRKPFGPLLPSASTIPRSFAVGSRTLSMPLVDGPTMPSPDLSASVGPYA